MNGALVISLDFELHWGIRDKVPFDRRTARTMDSARKVVRELLVRFGDDGIAATWATVGFLFAARRDDLAAHQPAVRPSYRNQALDPFQQSVGDDEGSDPAHYARTLIDEIRRTPRQEIATHTFSHYYCYEDRAGPAAFEADLASAVAIASSLAIDLRSVVFPRNQVPPAYLAMLARYGIRNYRGNARLGGSGDHLDPVSKRLQRLVRFADGFVPLSGRQAYPWAAIVRRPGPRNVRASAFLRVHHPGGARLRELHRQRLLQGLRHAARQAQVFHLWWHPHNLASDPEHGLLLLEAVIAEFKRLRGAYGMQSLTMDEAGDAAASFARR